MAEKFYLVYNRAALDIQQTPIVDELVCFSSRFYLKTSIAREALTSIKVWFIWKDFLSENCIDLGILLWRLKFTEKVLSLQLIFKL